MMARRDKEAILFTFSSLECKVLDRVLQAIIQNYQVPADELDEKTAAVWYSTRGCRTARMSAAEIADWIKQLQAVRSGRLELLKKWLGQIQSRPPGPFTVVVPIEQTETLMTALNDHRLLIAAQHDIGEAEMDMRTLSSFNKLPASKQSALYEIHFLAYIIEELLHLLQES